jgi:acetolactate synthase-1/2/3 large subunit
MADYRAGVQILDVLASFGVRAVFSSPGSEWPPLWEALDERAAAGRQPVGYSSRHEELSVMQAVGYTQASGTLSAVALHGSLGLLKAAMAIRYAYHARTPMVILTGETAEFGEGSGVKVGEHWQRSQSDRGGPAELARTFTKASLRVSAPEVMLGLLQDACRSALTAPQGPVVLSIPQEFLHRPVQGARRAPAPAWTAQPDPLAISAVVDGLLAAERPIVVSQSAGRRRTDFEALRRLAEALALPVYDASSPGFVNLPDDHPLFQGPATARVLEECDLILSIACPVPWYPASARPSSVRQVFQIDEHPAYDNLPYWGLEVDGVVGGSIASTLDAIRTAIADREDNRDDVAARTEARRERLAERRSARDARLAAELEDGRDSWPIDTRWLTAELFSLLPEDTVLLEEVTTDKANVLNFARRRTFGSYFGRISGGLGLVMGMAQGVKLAMPDRFVVQVLGDGGFHYSPALAAFGFADDYDVPVLTIVCNNASYASMVEAHVKYFPEGWGVKSGMKSVQISPPRYDEIAGAFGHWAAKVTDPASLRAALAGAVEAVRAGRSALVDVPTAPGKRPARSPAAD